MHITKGDVVWKVWGAKMICVIYAFYQTEEGILVERAINKAYIYNKAKQAIVSLLAKHMFMSKYCGVDIVWIV